MASRSKDKSAIEIVLSSRESDNNVKYVACMQRFIRTNDTKGRLCKQNVAKYYRYRSTLEHKIETDILTMCTHEVMLALLF